MIKESFFEVCREAKPAESHYLSLYVSIPFYGGPEEGGWWGSDTELCAYQAFPTEEALEAAKVKVEELAVQLNADAKKGFGEQCLREMDWLEARGLEADYLPEPDGEVTYYVVTEEEAGSRQCRGCRHYE